MDPDQTELIKQKLKRENNGNMSHNIYSPSKWIDYHKMRRDLEKNIVSKKHIKCLSYKQIVEENKEITPKCHNYLGNVKEFQKYKETMINFCNYEVKFFEGV